MAGVVSACEGDFGAIEMNWMDVPGEKLLEPLVTMVSICLRLCYRLSPSFFGLGGGIAAVLYM